MSAEADLSRAGWGIYIKSSEYDTRQYVINFVTKVRGSLSEFVKLTYAREGLLRSVMASFSLRLKEYCAELPDLRTVYVGEIYEGQIVAGYNPAHLDTDALTTHTTDVLRSLRRLHAAVDQPQESSYFISTNQRDRIIVQRVGSTSFYLAFVASASDPLKAYLATFKRVLEACRTHFSQDNVDITADADA